MVNLVSFYHHSPDRKTEVQLDQPGFHGHKVVGLWARALNHEAGKNLLMEQARFHPIRLPEP